MRGTKARELRKRAVQYSAVRNVGENKLNWVRHRNTGKSKPSFLKYSGYPRVYRDMKKSYKEGSMRV